MAFKCGLLGEKLSHSLSPDIHRRLGGYEYRLYEKRPDEVREFLLHGDYDVLNVTIPYKKTAAELCECLSEEAECFGNVNVVVKRLDGKLFGDNTDGYGFGTLLERVGFEAAGRKCVVLGSGGAAMTAKKVLERRGAGSVTVVSRSGADNYGNLERHADAALVVNATPVGMYPHVDAAPVSLGAFPRCEAVVDLVYNPSPTVLLEDARSRGIRAVGGMPMLEAQAEAASCHMNANLYLYGAPGSGKSTYARRLAAEKNLGFVDLDDEIESSRGMKISDIFASEGEAAFREIERRTLERVARGRNLVVALGGGALLDGTSRRLAEATGRVIVLDCPEETLLERVAKSSARPLLAGDAAARLRALLEKRRSHYASFDERIRS